MRDPVFYSHAHEFDGQIEDGWFFWDETWSYTYGPYATEQEARQILAGYIRENSLGD
ncbi:MAG: hypothetical protein ACREAE_01865 [Nitrosopumilaceae archaeon]